MQLQRVIETWKKITASSQMRQTNNYSEEDHRKILTH